MVAEYRLLLAGAAERAVAALPAPVPVPAGQGVAAEARLTQAVETALQQSVAAMNAARAARQAAIDTPTEYGRIGIACRRHHIES